MRSLIHIPALLWLLSLTCTHAQNPPVQQATSAPLPDIRQLMKQVQDHQKEVDKLRENDTYSALLTTQTLDSNGRVTKTETEEDDNFFVNGHLIARTIKKDGKPLSPHEDQKETERITKLAQKAEITPTDQQLEGPSISISRMLELMDVRNPRRENYRGRPTIIFDFIGRKDAKTHGMIEDVSKKLQGTIWVDEGDRQVAHIEVTFNDNFRVAGGIVATLQKGSYFYFDQAPVGNGVWLPTGGEGNMQAKVLMVKSYRQHYLERDYDFKKFSVDANESGGNKPVHNAKP